MKQTIYIKPCLPLFIPELRECRDYGDLANGMRILNGTREGSIVGFRCNDGYSILGNRQIVCGGDGEWQSKWPLCIKALTDILMQLAT